MLTINGRKPISRPSLNGVSLQDIFVFLQALDLDHQLEEVLHVPVVGLSNLQEVNVTGKAAAAILESPESEWQNFIIMVQNVT